MEPPPQLMPFERIEREGVVFYAAEEGDGGLSCAFSTRQGGVSEGRCASMNLGLTRHDPKENVLENRRRFEMAAGFSRPKMLRQVHSATVLDIPSEEEDGVQEGDALVSGTFGRALGILTADCLPVILHDPVPSAIGIAHASRVGTAQGVSAAAVKKMVDRHGADPSRLRAYLGPGIGPCCYEVGKDVLGDYQRRVPGWREFATPRGEDRFALDLWGLNRSQLESAGVPARQIHCLDLCTACRPDEFFSYRRDGLGTGRMMSVVFLKG